MLYAARHHRPPDFRSPRTFTEKVNWRILNDRREILAPTCDKLQTKEDALGLGIATPRTLWAGVEIRETVGLRLPDTWVLKPNHRSGLVHFGRGPITHLYAAELVSLTREWMDDYLGRSLGEWAYSRARPMVLIEEMVGTARSRSLDFRFYTFDGIVKCIQVDDSYERHDRRFYTPDWKPLEVRQRSALAKPISAPAGLGKMTSYAQRLGAPFDFMRVDLYATDGSVYLGELTPYPCGGLVPFNPVSFDTELGRAWALPRVR